MNKSVITTFDQFQDWCNKNWKPIMALDWETDSLNHTQMNPVGFSVANNSAVAYIQWSSSIVEPLRHLILDSTDLLICHNSCFDLKCLKKFCNCEPKNIFCTLTAAQLINENLPSYSLKYLAEHWLNIPPGQIKKWDDVKDNINSNDYIEYAMHDSKWTWDLFQLESKELKKQNLEYLAYEIEFPFQKTLRDLEINGIAVDKDKLEEYRNDCQDMLLSIECDMLDVFGKKHNICSGLFGQCYTSSPINFGSSNQLCNCINNLGFKIDEKTPKGNPSVGKKYLQRMRGKHKFFDLLWKYRKLQKLYNSFLEPCEDFIDSDGRIRPSYHMVRTGRLAATSPNLMQLPNPKREKLDFNYRKIFIPKGD